METPSVRKIAERLKAVFTFDAAGALKAVAALLPFERIGSVHVGGVSVRPSQLALAAALAFALRAFLRGKTHIVRPAPLGWLLAFFAVAALSMINAENLPRSLMILGFSVFTATLAFLIPNFLDAPERLNHVRAVILISAALVGLFGLWQFLGDMAGLPTALTGLRSTYSKAILGFTRIQSTALEPLYFANYLLLPLGLTLAWLLGGRPEKKIAVALWALAAILTVDVVLTSSRGGYGGFIVMLAVLAWSFRRSAGARRALGGFLIAGIAAVSVSLALLSAYAVTTPGTLADTFIKHVSTLTDGAAYVERAETSANAFEAFKRHPWLGVGFGGYGPFVSTFPFRAPDSGWPIVNDEYLEILAETGVAGLALFVMFMVSVFVKSVRPVGEDIDAIRVGALAALAGMMVQYLTFSTLYIMHIWFTIGLVLVFSRKRT